MFIIQCTDVLWLFIVLNHSCGPDIVVNTSLVCAWRRRPGKTDQVCRLTAFPSQHCIGLSYRSNTIQQCGHCDLWWQKVQKVSVHKYLLIAIWTCSQIHMRQLFVHWVMFSEGWFHLCLDWITPDMCYQSVCYYTNIEIIHKGIIFHVE